MRRFLVATTVVLLLAVTSGQTAVAGTKWCAVDPILSVDGRVSDVTVAFMEDKLSAVRPPVEFRFHVPSNSRATVKLPPSPVAYTVELRYDLPPRLKRDVVTVTVETLVSASEVFETQTIVHLSKVVSIAVAGLSGSTTTITYSLR